MQTIIVDMTPGYRMPTIYFSQGDVGTQFAIDLRSRFGDSLPASPTVTIQATKPSGFGFTVAATSLTNGVAVFTTTAEMTDEAGRFPAELKVVKDNVTLFSANFGMEGEANTHPAGTIDGSQETVIPELTQLVERAEDAASSVLDRQTVTNTLPAGSQATYSFDEGTNTQTFGIPQGEAGAGAAGVTASAYSASKTYAVGDYVIHNSNLYRCTTAITTAEAFTAAHWTQVVLADDVSDVKSAINNIYSDKNEIAGVTGWRYIISGGKLTKSATTYWKAILAPVSCVYIDGVATLKSGGLAGNESQSIPSMAFIDENWNVLSAVYTTIPAPHTFSIDDVPSGAAYVVCHFADDFKFAFQPTAKTLQKAQSDIDSLDSEISDAGKYDIDLVFTDATGYYDKNGSFVTYSSVKKCSVSVNEGEVYFLTSKNYYGLARAVFFASDSSFVSSVYSGNNTSLNENTKVVVPQNATTMVVQSIDEAVSYVELYKADLSERVDLLNDELLDIESVTTQKTGTDVTLTFSAAAGYYNKNKSFDTYSGVTVAKVSVIKGEQYLLDSRSYYNAAIACLLDSTEAVKSVIWISNNAAQQKNIVIDIPEGISYLLIQRFDNYKPTSLRKVTGITAKPIKSVLDGKRVTLIGDSITEINLRANTNWALWMNEWCNAIIQNLGASGTGFIAGGANPYHNRIASISNPDIIGIAVSFNDMSNTLADLTTAAETFFDDLITAYPTTPIICYVQSPWSAFHYGVETSDAWIDALKDVCNKRGVPFYDDMYKGAVLKPWLAANRAVYYINDGDGNTGEEDWVHPNSEGHKAIARCLYPKFAENIVAVGLDYNN